MKVATVVLSIIFMLGIMPDWGYCSENSIKNAKGVRDVIKEYSYLKELISKDPYTTLFVKHGYSSGMKWELRGLYLFCMQNGGKVYTQIDGKRVEFIDDPKDPYFFKFTPPIEVTCEGSNHDFTIKSALTSYKSQTASWGAVIEEADHVVLVTTKDPEPLLNKPETVRTGFLGLKSVSVEEAFKDISIIDFFEKAFEAFSKVKQVNDRIHGSWIEGESGGVPVRHMFEYCSVNGGEFLIDNGFMENASFFDYLLQRYLKGDWRMLGERPVGVENVTGTLAKLTGLYTCKGGKRPFSVIVLSSPTYRNIHFTMEEQYNPNIALKHTTLSLLGDHRMGKTYAELKDTVRANRDARSSSTAGSDLEQFALNIATKRTNSVKLIGAQELTGIYNGVDANGCDLVSVKKNWNVNNTRKPLIVTYNYTICSGKITTKSETPLEALPRDIDRVIQSLARTSQRYGRDAESEHGGLIIKASPLRDKDKCLVEIKILKGGNLIEHREVNGCN